MAAKFPLKMADGAAVRTLEELREHFDLTAVLGYYDNGRLVKWLENFFYDDEARKIADLDRASVDFVEKLCEILGISCSGSKAAQVNLDSIVERNRRIELLKQYTADDEILAAVDRVAFNQDELDDLASRYGRPVPSHWLTSDVPPADFFEEQIYLVGDYFTIPSDRFFITYIGVNRPKITLPPLPDLSISILTTPFWLGLGFHNVEFDIDCLVKYGYDNWAILQITKWRVF